MTRDGTGGFGLLDHPRSQVALSVSSGTTIGCYVNAVPVTAGEPAGLLQGLG